MNFKEQNIIYTSNVREAIYYSLLTFNKDRYLLFSNQWKNLYRTIITESTDGIEFCHDTKTILNFSGASHNFFPFFGENGKLFGIGGVDNWKFDKEFHSIEDYTSFKRTYEYKFRKSCKNEVFNLSEHKRLLSDKPALDNVRGLYLFHSDNGIDWKLISKSPIVTVFNAGYANAINLFGKSSEFDGHVNCLYHKGIYRIYLRANIDKGKRFIQYAESSDLLNWSRFKLIKLDSYLPNDNYYTPCFMEYNGIYIGFVPYFSDGGVCAIRFIKSTDGVNWNLIRDLYEDKVALYRGEKPKNTKHMVHGYILRNKEIYFYIHNNFSGLDKEKDVTIQRISVSKKEFEKCL